MTAIKPLRTAVRQIIAYTNPAAPSVAAKLPRWPFDVQTLEMAILRPSMRPLRRTTHTKQISSALNSKSESASPKQPSQSPLRRLRPPARPILATPNIAPPSPAAWPTQTGAQTSLRITFGATSPVILTPTSNNT